MEAGASGTRSRPGSPWMPTPSSISSSPSSNVGRPAEGTVQDVSARPMLRPLAFTRFATRPPDPGATLLRCRAAIFSSSTVTPTPRRPAVQVLSWTATLSSVTTDATALRRRPRARPPSRSSSRRRCSSSPRGELAPPATALVAASIWSGTGEAANISPAQAASSMPKPTKPPCRGSCPEPPPETMPTLPGRGASPRTMILFWWSILSSGWAASIPRSASVHHGFGIVDELLHQASSAGGVTLNWSPCRGRGCPPTPVGGVRKMTGNTAAAAMAPTNSAIR